MTGERVVGLIEISYFFAAALMLILLQTHVVRVQYQSKDKWSPAGLRLTLLLAIAWPVTLMNIKKSTDKDDDDGEEDGE